MKKTISIACISTFLAFALSGCLTNFVEQKTETDTTEEKSVQTLEERAEDAITLLKNKDMQGLSKVVHPDKGVRFSPYTFVKIDEDVVLTANEIRNIEADSRLFVWGVYDGSGEPIEKPFMVYFDEFVYDQDFANAEKTGVNEVIGKGNTINNITEVYPSGEFVEYHFSGFDPEYGGMDWESLRLVFEEKDGVWYLVGIIHDGWTI